MSLKGWMAVLLVAAAIVLAVIIAPAYAAKGGVKGKPEAIEAASKEKGQAKSEGVAKSNGSGDMKGPGESNTMAMSLRVGMGLRTAMGVMARILAAVSTFRAMR